MSIENFLKNKGIARDKSQANMVMILIICLCVVIAFFVLRGSGSENTFDENSLSPVEQEFLGIQQGELN